MPGYLKYIYLVLITSLAGGQAEACIGPASLNIIHIRFAQLVFIGRISRYEIIHDLKAREEYRRIYAANPKLYRTIPSKIIKDYARIEVEVINVIKGSAGERVTFTWNNSTFAEPDAMPPGTYLITLHNATSDDFLGQLPSPDPSLPAVLQSPCAPPFILEDGSEHAIAARRVLEK